MTTNANGWKLLYCKAESTSSLGFPNLPSVKLALVAAFVCSGRVNCNSLLGVLQYIVKLKFVEAFIALQVGSCLLFNSKLWSTLKEFTLFY